MYTSRTVCLPWGHRRHAAFESFMWLSSLVREINITITLILNKTNTSKLFGPTQWSDKRHYNQNEDIQIKRKKEVTTTFSKSKRNENTLSPQTFASKQKTIRNDIWVAECKGTTERDNSICSFVLPVNLVLGTVFLCLQIKPLFYKYIPFPQKIGLCFNACQLFIQGKTLISLENSFWIQCLTQLIALFQSFSDYL